jgi:tetratricopeptide (TPR) repeat protein
MNDATNTSVLRRTSLLFLVLTTLVASMIAGSGCSTTRIQVPTLRPAEINIAGAKRIVVSDFRNTTMLSNEGDQLEFALTRRLIDVQRFAVLDKQLFDRFVKQDASATNDVLVISGVVNEYSFADPVSQGPPYKDKQGNTLIDYRRDGIVRLGVTFQVARVSDGRVIASKALLQEVRGSTRSTNAPPPPLSLPAMVADAREQLVSMFLRKLLPYEEMMGVDFYSEKSMPELDDGISAAQRGDWERALETFGRTTEKYSREKLVHIAWYNLALAYQCVYRFVDAEQAFYRALQLDPNNTAYRNALDACRQMEADYRRAYEQSN